MGRRLSRHACTLFASVAIAPTLISHARAEEAGSNRIQEIVVTARRRVENILEVPAAVSAMTGEEMRKTGIRNFDDLQLTTPGYYVMDGGDFVNVYIRGVGNDILIGADPSVAIFVDDVPRITGLLFNQFADTERVEVLKGAQGGLYGRNATGGVINVVTRQPSTERMSAEARLSYGEHSTLSASAYANMPLGDKAALSVAIQRDYHRPYVKNVAFAAPYTAAMFPSGSFLGAPAQTAAYFNSGVRPPKGLANQDAWSGDVKLLLKPADNFKVTVAYDHSDKGDSTGAQFYQEFPAYALAVAQNGFFGQAGIAAQLPQSLAVSGTGKFTTSKPVPSRQNIRDYGGSVTAVLSLPGVDLTSISAYRANHSLYYDDIENLPIPTLQVTSGYRRRFFYQEVRAISTGAGRFHWLGGATYLDDRNHSTSIVDLLPPLVVSSTPTVVSTQKVRNWSAYLQLGYDITEALNLTVSGRYIHETNRSVFTLPLGDHTNATETKFLPSATLSYRLSGGGNAYVRWARGFKTGGVNPQNPPSFFPRPDLGAVFGGETVDTYEAGYRARLLDGRMQVTTAAFYNDYRNLQITAHANPAHANIILVIVNGGAARSYGVEGSLAWRIADPLTLGVNAAYLNAKYKDLKVTDTTVLVPFDLSGTTMVNAPKFQLSLTAALDQPISDRLHLIGNVVASRTSKILFQQSGLPGVLPAAAQAGYWLANARLGVRTADERYEAAVSVSNLFDKGYTTFGTSSASSGNVYQWGNPRIVRVELTAKY
jgi:iron complex outermembrane receptor protein